MGPPRNGRESQWRFRISSEKLRNDCKRIVTVDRRSYESKLFYNVEATLDGPLRIRTRDFASSTTHALTEDGRRLDKHTSGASEYMGVAELDAGLEQKENIWSLHNLPWMIHGSFNDMTREERRSANSKNNALRKIQKKGTKTETFHNTVHESKSAPSTPGEKDVALDMLGET